MFCQALSTVQPSLVSSNSLSRKKKLREDNKQYQATNDLEGRFPIQTERAIYRLSHMKLGNVKRPLRQQVTISNLMFWYLSITEKDQKRNHEVAAHLARRIGEVIEQQ